MKKIISIIFIFNLISVSIGLSNDFSEFYPEQTDVILNFDIAQSKEYLNWTKDSMIDKRYNEVLSCLNKKLSIDISKDIKEIRICFINVKMGFLSMDNSVPFIFIKGNFNNKNSWNHLLNSLIKETTNAEPKLTKLTINGDEKQVFTAKNLQFIQLSDSILLMGINGTSNLIESKQISFVQEPKCLTKLSSITNSYAYFTRKNLWKIIFISNLFYESKHFISVSTYIKDNVINIIGNIDDPNVVEEETKIFKEDINKFYDNYKRIYEHEKKLLRKTSLNYFPIIAKRTYIDALYKKIINNIKVTNNEDSIIVSLPFDNYLIKHTLFNLIDAGITTLYLNLNDATLTACIANQKVLAAAISAYNNNDNSNLHYDFSLKEKDEKDEYYKNRKIKERIMKPNKSGKTTMIIDVDTLLKNDCLDIEPIKPDPECEYVVYREFSLNNYKVFCLKHSFCIPTNRSRFGGVFRRGDYDPGFLNPGKKQIINIVNCYKNQRQLTNSIENYNKTHDNKITKFDVTKLIESGCIDKAPEYPEQRCQYFSFGDLSTDDGSIYCTKHGPESYKKENESDIQDIIRLRNLNFSKVNIDEIDKKDIKTILNCAINIRMITGSIITNNEKEETKITTSMNIPEMLKNEKIWRDPKKNNPDCEYYIEGDMTKDGHISCKTHGYINE